MKNLKIRLTLFSLLAIFVALTSCKKDVDDNENNEPSETLIEDLLIPVEFDFNTAVNINIEITTKSNNDDVVSFVPVNIYSDLPENGGKLLYSGVSNVNGVLSTKHPMPAYLTEVVVATDYLGLPDYVLADVSNNSIVATLGGKPSFKSGRETVPFKSSDATLVPMGDYNSIGVPDYLVDPGDVVDPGLLAMVNTNLPEHNPLPNAHPEWILPDRNYDFEITEYCDAWITFVDEGAGWKNVLGFYTYQTNNPPATKDDIETINIIFPNASKNDGGGGLYAGDKVHLGQYEAGTSIGIVLLANGWSQSSQTVNMGSHQVYSNPDFNPQYGGTNNDVRQQFVMLYDSYRDLILIGIEDQLRPGGDKDFNDAIFYVTVNPIEAISPENYPEPDPIEDTDGDGVPDNVDEYPEDEYRAFNVYYPGEDQYGTLAFEDLWPGLGDYDFNDMVVDYNIQHVTDANNDIVDITGTFKLRAMGANYENAFGIQFGEVSPSMVEEIVFTYEDASTQIITPESAQSKLVAVFWENGFDLLPRQGNGIIGANTTLGNLPEKENYTLQFTVSTVEGNPINRDLLGLPPYNPFIFINGERGREAHLRDFAPTDLVDASYFGTHGDASIPSQGIYYKTKENLPWAIHIIESFDYPGEKIPIIDAYLHFAEWAESGGTNFSDWYQNNAGYRNESNIY